jgi:hypothetical protein
MNKPSIRENFEIIPRSGDRKIEKGKGDYNLVIHDSAYRRKDIRKFWGASDGVSVFVNECMYGRPFNLKKIHGVGRYCYFKGSQPEGPPILPVNLDMVAAKAIILAVDPEYTYILNINNGKFFILTKAIMTTILKKDEALLKEYEEESKMKSDVVLVDYIQKYNARHADEADLDKIIPIEVVMYRRSKKENELPFTILTPDSLDYPMEVNSFHKFEVIDDTLSLCLNGKCENIPLIKRKVNYIHSYWKADAPQPGLELVDQKEGEFYLKETTALLLQERKTVILHRRFLFFGAV